MKRITARIAVLLALLALVAAACGDDSGSPFGSSTTAAAEPTTTQPGGPATTSGAGEQTTTTVGGQTTTGQAGEGEIDQLLTRFQSTPLRTTYLVGEERSEMTFSQDPTQDPPVSAVLFEGGKLVTRGDSYIVCSGEGEGSQCFEMPDQGGVDMASAMLGPFASLALSLQGLDEVSGVEVDTEQVTVAGRTGVCFTYTPESGLNAGYEYVRSCIDAELGFSLLVEVREPGASSTQTVMELVSFGAPEPGDFEPTGPVTTMPEG